MLELLTSNRGGDKKQYPNSGPGAIVLEYGDEEFGYFGTVPSTDLFTTDELSRGIDLYTGVAHIASPTWIKVILKGKICFTPSVPLRRNVGWSDVYNSGGVYGNDTDGTYPATPAIKQDAVVVKGAFAYRVRLWGKGDIDPSAVADGTYPFPANHEFGRFICQLYDGTHASFSKSWKVFPISSVASLPTLQIMTAAANIVNSIRLTFWSTPPQLWCVVSAKTSTTYWWPVLELFDFVSNGLLPVKKVIDQPLDDNLLSKVGITSLAAEMTTPGDLLAPISVNGLRYDTTDPKPVAITTLGIEPSADWLTPISAVGIKQPTLLSSIDITSLKYEP